MNPEDEGTQPDLLAVNRQLVHQAARAEFRRCVDDVQRQLALIADWIEPSIGDISTGEALHKWVRAARRFLGERTVSESVQEGAQKGAQS
jgi:hypothetical protein